MSKTEIAKSTPIGLDIGTSRIVAARKPENDVQYEIELNAFVALPYTKMTENAPLAVQATLQNGRIAQNQGWKAAYEQVAPTQQRLYNSEDAKEGVQSFLEKRDAHFVGR